MKWFERKQPAAGASAQIRSGERQPFWAVDNYVPLTHGEVELYRAIREALPLVDAAVGKLIRLCGGVRVKSREGQAGLEEFLERVPTGRGQQGLQSFLDMYLDSMLVCGRGVGEMVVDRRRGEITALLCADPAGIVLREGEDPLQFAICAKRPDGSVEELPRQELLFFTPNAPEADNPYGVSLMRSMPFVAGVLLKIYKTIGVNWERMGNTRYAVVYKPGEGDGPWARERGEEIAREWQNAMQSSKNGTVKDFVAVGDVEIKVIGADGEMVESRETVRELLEQIVAKTGIPPFLLGLSWSSTERMSAQQADMMTTEVTAIRRSLEPVIRRICQMWLRLHGYSDRVEILWEDINLQDLMDEARAELYRAQAEQLRKENEDGDPKGSQCGAGQ